MLSALPGVRGLGPAGRDDKLALFADGSYRPLQTRDACCARDPGPPLSQFGGLQAVAASPEGAVNGYAIGSYLYLGIVFMLPMGLGLGGLALDLPVCLPSPLPLHHPYQNV